ncbi:MAG: type II CAAX endopeptidase family protein [Thermoanaerobaculia bacterium]
MKPTVLYSPEPARGWLPWGALAPVLCLFLVALPAIAAWKVENFFGLVDVKGVPTGFAGFCSLLFFDFGVTGAILLAWVRWVEKRTLPTIGLVADRGLRRFVRGLGVGLATSGLVVALIGLAGGYATGELFPALRSPTAVLKIAVLLAGFAVQSSVEEILFRGWLLSAVARKLNLTLGVFLTSLVFMMLHYSPHQAWDLMLGTFVFSLFACAWALESGSIWGVMGWHAAWNWLIGVGFELPITGLNLDLPALLVQLTPVGGRSMNGGVQGPEGSFLCTLFFASASAFLFLRNRQRRQRRGGTGILVGTAGPG